MNLGLLPKLGQQPIQGHGFFRFGASAFWIYKWDYRLQLGLQLGVPNRFEGYISRHGHGSSIFIS